jgi:tellurium resistance protein TerD
MSNSIVVLDMKKTAGNSMPVLNMAKIALDALKRLTITVYWSENSLVGGKDYDLDLSSIFLNANGKPNIEQADGHPDLLFFNSGKNAEGFAQVHGGAGVLPKDERKGGSEEMRFDYSKVPDHIKSIDHYVTIYEGSERGQTFLLMADAKAVLTNTDTGAEIQTYSLANFTNDTALHLGSSIRNTQGGWEFQPAGTARALDLPGILGLYAS